VSLQVKHFRTLCSLGLPPEAALIAIAQAICEIVPASWARIGFNNAQALPTIFYGAHPDFLGRFIRDFDRFYRDPNALLSTLPRVWPRPVVGATLHLQNADYLDSAYYREFERPLDSCWLLDAILDHEGTSIGSMALSRPRAGRPFVAADAARLDSVRPWIAYAMRHGPAPASEDPQSFATRPSRRATLVLDCAGGVQFESAGCGLMFYILGGSPEVWRCAGRLPLPAVVQRLIQRLKGVANGEATAPPSVAVSTSWGLVTVEAHWLITPGAPSSDVARDPHSMSIAVQFEYREPAAIQAARILRENGASPTQVHVGVMLALGKSKPEIARALAVQLSSVEDAVRKLYSRLAVSNVVEFGASLWLSPDRGAKVGKPIYVPQRVSTRSVSPPESGAILSEDLPIQFP
jgi:DNA-binding CsgD family transcriptional regulator